MNQLVHRFYFVFQAHLFFGDKRFYKGVTLFPQTEGIREGKVKVCFRKKIRSKNIFY